eukprot:COSAG06_NODE_64591_length_259_cov_0.643750_1_plen_37_part_01
MRIPSHFANQLDDFWTRSKNQNCMIRYEILELAHAPD